MCFLMCQCVFGVLDTIPVSIYSTLDLVCSDCCNEMLLRPASASMPTCTKLGYIAIILWL